jgi:SAM-dependent methyltransferase
MVDPIDPSPHSDGHRMIRKRIKYFLGAILARLDPETTERIRLSFTLPHTAGEIAETRMSRLIRLYLGERASHDAAQLEALHKGFWAHQTPGQWFGKTAERFSRQAIPLVSDIIERCTPEIEARQIRRVCELGAGDGQGLDLLQRHWKGPNEFVGVDLAKEQIELNRERYPNLRFDCADLTEWVRSHAAPQSIYVTLFGVLEYLSQDSVSALLARIVAGSPRSLVLFVEPLSPEFDLDRQPDSQVLGVEFSYSHNYPRLLEAAGLEILVQEERPWPGYRMLAILAATGPG